MLVIPRERLGWYGHRLASMSLREMTFRVTEQLKRAADSGKPRSWANFGKFEGQIRGLPGLVFPDSVDMLAYARREAARIKARKFRLLNQEWPATQDWDSIWLLDPVTGATWPGAETFAFDVNYRQSDDKGDVKFVWELNRLQFLPVLAIAGEYDLLPVVLRSWMIQNPPFRGINWTSGIEAASRVVSLLSALALLPRDRRESLQALARPFLDAHLFWIRRYPSLYSSANNHRVAELVAEFLCALCAPGLPHSKQLLAGSRAELEERMQKLFFADGVGAEQAVLYAAYALEWFAIAGIAADATGESFGAEYKGRAAKAAGHLAWVMDDAAGIPAIGDADETRALAFGLEPEERYVASVTALVARWLAQADLCPPASDMHVRDLLGDSVAASGRLQHRGMRVFGAGGYTVFREQTESGTLVCVFDHGPLGFESIAAHGHADALSIWLSWGDEPIFVDAGTYLYHSGGAWRDYFRSTRAHNTLAIEGADQSKIAGPFNWSRHARARIVDRTPTSLTAEHDGYYRKYGLIHRRTIAVMSCGNVTVEDQLIGSGRQSGLQWQVGFTLAPAIRAAKRDKSIILTTRNHRALRVTVGGTGSMPGLSSVPYSPNFGKRTETARIVLSGVATGGCGVISRFEIECGSNA